MVGIINFHFSNNFGAVLQCIALQEYIRSKGKEVLVINYQPEYIRQQQEPFPNPVYFAKWALHEFSDSNIKNKIIHTVIRSAHALYMLKDAALKRKRNIVFSEYISKHLKLSQRYNNYKMLETNPPECDVYISGSDQVWNPKVTYSDLDPAYFLQFVPDTNVKVAYAVSPCQLDVKKFEKKLVSYLKGFNYVSLREKQLLFDLSQVCNKRISVCIDPTLLLAKESYLGYEEEILDEGEYILTYGFKDGKKPNVLNSVAKYIANETGLKVIDISLEDVKFDFSIIKRRVLSPGQFLMYIKKAKYVVTNSFHGTAFSIVYHKNFWSIEKKVTASRMKELMYLAGLSSRLLTDYDSTKIKNDLNSDIDYHLVEELLDEMRNSSKDFLNLAIGDNKDA